MSEQPHGGTGRWLKRITQSMSGEPRDLAQLIEDLREASERGLFDGDALVMLEGVLSVADMQVRDIMVPRSQMVFVQRDEPADKLVALVVESGHSRFPVIGEDRDQILGILLAKDLLRLQMENAEEFDIREYMRPVVFVPESKRLNVLLKEFRRNHNHIAMVVDEYGGVCGLVTIEDVIEQIVGEIGDEHDVEDDLKSAARGRANSRCARSHPIADFNDFFADRFFRRGIRYDQRPSDAGVQTAAAPRRDDPGQRPGFSRGARRPAPHRHAAGDDSHRHRTAGDRRVFCLTSAPSRIAAAFPRTPGGACCSPSPAGAGAQPGFAPFGWWPLAVLAPAALLHADPRSAAAPCGLDGRRLRRRLVRLRHLLAVHLHPWLRPGADLAHAASAGGAGRDHGGYSAALCFIANRFWLKAGATRDWLVLPALWVLLEWLRGWVLSGFPWLCLGYAFIDAPLAGWAPLLGVYGVTAAAAFSASALNVLLSPVGSSARRLAAVAAVALLFLLPVLASRHAWTQAGRRAVSDRRRAGRRIAGSEMAGGQSRLDDLALSELTAQSWGARLIVWPESALPVLAGDLSGLPASSAGCRPRAPCRFRDWAGQLPAGDAAVLQRMLVLSAQGGGWYYKRHLVPFGEYFPVPSFVRSWMRLMSLPYEDLTPGSEHQPVLSAAGPEARADHLLRGCLRQQPAEGAAPGDAADQRHQQRLVRRFDRPASTPADLAHARAGGGTLSDPRGQRRHYGGDRPAGGHHRPVAAIRGGGAARPSAAR